MRLFGGGRSPALDHTLSRAVRLELGEGAFVEHVPGWLTGDDVLFDHLLTSTRWTAGEREMYERRVAIPRLFASLPEDGPGHPVLEEAAAALSWRYERDVSTISLALYRDGHDSVAFHGDRMGDQLDDCIVAILSLRGPRQLRLRSRSSERTHSFLLGHGDLLVMGGSCQRHYEHAVPKCAWALPRMAVVFRS
jgi:alkylated DNA repair dioxygenase AlkB